MEIITAHSAAQSFEVVLDNKRLEEVMDKESNTIAEVRLIKKANYIGMETKTVTGTITARLRSLLVDTDGCVVQKDFRDRVIINPAYPLITADIQKANEEGRLDKLFDEIEQAGVIIALDKKEGKVTIGLNRRKMEAGIKEHTPMVCSNDKRSLDFINQVGPYGQPRVTKSDEEPMVGMSTTFYITFQL